ncbi:tetratricopeptide repeat protein [Sphingomonas sp. BIUV-7]|uniref:Tetratricopeptide repeat protein n=1 Tax=Sphingomonas natans TaxID=3063330 RepID=A0ABT8YE10_9SPHN|nr:tetratricopeptide repeat protein [Sphingomonas sp. BIUV-7]MDO6416598.1 tetratricopeptide repeat protein [Sphingomonas sp. BIUV-7]
MALTPQNNEAFFREVDEEVRRDRAVAFFTRYGKVIAALVALALVALAGWLWWKSHLAQQAGQDSEKLAPALANLEAGNSPTAPDAAALAQVGDSPRDGYRALAGLALADTAAMKGDTKGAAARYAGIAADQGIAQPVRDVALLRSIAIRFDTMPSAEVIATLKPLVVPGQAFFASAAEYTALAELKLGHNQTAAKLLATIARDQTAPATLRGRAAGLATTLGETIEPADTVSKG